MDKLEVGDNDVLARIELPAGAIDKAGTYHLKFQYTGGGCAADFKNVKLLANSTVVASDAHDGGSGNSSTNNDYALAVHDIPMGAHFSIQFQIKGRGGADSQRRNPAYPTLNEASARESASVRCFLMRY